MKIAVPTRNQVVDDHFGHCEAYTLFTIAENKIIDTEEVPSPQGCGCKSNIAGVLKQKGVSVMLAGNMGNGALNILQQHGIEVYRGCAGNIRQVVETYLKGDIKDSAIACQHHDHSGNDHVCSHSGQ